MHRFAIRKMDTIEGEVFDFYDLYIDGVSVIESFTDEVTPQYRSHLRRTYTTMEQRANGKFPPGTKWHKIESKKVEGLEEFKYQAIRVYTYHHKPTGKIIVLCSYQKTKQPSDIKEAERVIKSLPEDILILYSDEDLKKYRLQLKDK